jgi:hypothetical protein
MRRNIGAIDMVNAELTCTLSGYDISIDTIVLSHLVEFRTMRKMIFWVSEVTPKCLNVTNIDKYAAILIGKCSIWKLGEFFKVNIDTVTGTEFL